MEADQVSAEKAGLRPAAKTVLPGLLCPRGLSIARGYILDLPSYGCSLQPTGQFGDQNVT